ncbi:hypothetical protein T08_1648 [Trichinella sp. T8]|nr:hypothetical protein T08_1648 [Trichinella sp. T8]
MVATTVVINRTADDNQPITAKITHQQSLYTSGYYCNLSDLQVSQKFSLSIALVRSSCGKGFLCAMTGICHV